MNPRLTDPRLLDHHDYGHDSGLPVDYWSPPDPFAARWFYIGVGIALGISGTTLVFAFLLFPLR
jgi:hypothetical protein